MNNSIFWHEESSEKQPLLSYASYGASPERVRSMIEEVARDYDAEEVFIVNIMHSHEARKRSYELIARAFGLA